MSAFETLRRLPALREYADLELELLVQMTFARSLLPGVRLIEQGAAGDSCFFILDGEVEVRKKTRGQERVVGTLRSGAIVGLVALVDHAPRSASVVATTNTNVLELRRGTFDAFVDKATPLALRFQARIAVAAVRQLRGATERLSTLIDERASAMDYMHVQAQLDDWSLDDDAPSAAIDLAYDPRLRGAAGVPVKESKR